MTSLADRRISLVLGGGGTRGFAHVGAIEAVLEAGGLPLDVTGSSMGALVAAAWCAGMSVREMRHLLEQVRRADLFQIAHRHMALKRMRSPGLYRPEPLADFIRGLLGDLTFADLERPLRISTVDINSGTQVLWGAPGLTDLPVADAVRASIALPGFFPAVELRGRWYIDGAVAGNLPIQATVTDRDLVLAVDVGSANDAQEPVQDGGFAAVWARAIEMGVRRMDHDRLTRWASPPMLLVRPDVGRAPLLDFKHNAELADAGRDAVRQALADGQVPPADAVGVWPRREVDIAVDGPTCVGCGTCVRLQPHQFVAADEGKATVRNPRAVWSPVDWWVVHQCPTGAITARRTTPEA